MIPADASTVAPAPDLGAIKGRQQATWASGDYHMIGTQIQLVAELLIEALDVHSTERVLDVATGSGNAALAAARRRNPVVGLDYVPSLLERARRRADAEGLEIEFVEGDAEALPFDDGSFDVVSSVFGVMFAPDQERTAAELARVCRPGGRIGLVAHTPEGFIGQLQKRHYVFRDRSPEAYIQTWRRYYGPALKTFEAVGVDGRVALEADLLELIARFNRAKDGTMVVPSEYLEAVIVRQ